MQPVCNRRPNRRQSCCSEETLALLEIALLEGLTDSGGEGGIRTPDRGVSPYNGLANRRLQPLGHLSGVFAAAGIVSVDGHLQQPASTSFLFIRGCFHDEVLRLACASAWPRGRQLPRQDFAQ